MVKKTTLYNSDNEKLYPRTSAECVGYGDGTVKDALDNVGVADYPTFSASTAYSAGDVVNYQGKLYQFTTSHAAGAWTGTDAEETDTVKAHIVQELGNSEDKVVSQKAVTKNTPSHLTAEYNAVIGQTFQDRTTFLVPESRKALVKISCEDGVLRQGALLTNDNKTFYFALNKPTWITFAETSDTFGINLRTVDILSSGKVTIEVWTEAVADICSDTTELSEKVEDIDSKKYEEVVLLLNEDCSINRDTNTIHITNYNFISYNGVRKILTEGDYVISINNYVLIAYADDGSLEVCDNNDLPTGRPYAVVAFKDRNGYIKFSQNRAYFPIHVMLSNATTMDTDGVVHIGKFSFISYKKARITLTESDYNIDSNNYALVVYEDGSLEVVNNMSIPDKNCVVIAYKDYSGKCFLMGKEIVGDTGDIENANVQPLIIKGSIFKDNKWHDTNTSAKSAVYKLQAGHIYDIVFMLNDSLGYYSSLVKTEITGQLNEQDTVEIYEPTGAGNTLYMPPKDTVSIDGYEITRPTISQNFVCPEEVKGLTIQITSKDGLTSLKEMPIVIDRTYINTDETKYNNLRNCKIAVLGDSVSQQPASEFGKEYVRAMLDATLDTYGVGGAGFSIDSNPTWTSGSDKNTSGVYQALELSKPDAPIYDVYCLSATLNDPITHGVQMGEITDAIPYAKTGGDPDLTDAALKTMCGGINFAIQRLYEKNPNCKIVLGTMNRCKYENGGSPAELTPLDGTTFQGHTYYEWVKKIKELGEYWNIPVVDVYGESGINSFNWNTYMDDNYHPNTKGYYAIWKLWFDKIVSA